LSSAREPDPPAWIDAAIAAAMLAVDPHGLGGAVIRAPAGPARDRFLAILKSCLAPDAPVRRIPAHVTDGRLLGGLDLAATLRAGRPIAERGLLAEADGGVVVVPLAERLSVAAAARIAAVLDAGEVLLERDGLAGRSAARIGVVALDEGAADDELPPAALLDRLAFHLDLTAMTHRHALDACIEPAEVEGARERLAAVEASDPLIGAFCATAAALGIPGVRPVILALRVARVAAALDGRDHVNEADAAIAGRLVFASRATVLPPAEDAPENEPAPEPPPAQAEDDGKDEDVGDRPLEDVVLEAARAALPPDLLAALLTGGPRRTRSSSAGRGGDPRQSRRRGRPAGTYRGELRAGARLNVVETLRAAAPWQPVRRREREARSGVRSGRVEVRRDDFRITRFKQRAQSTTIFVVDASGSAALHRLAEAKGAVELLLADCYIRRDQVALIAFRGRDAEPVLPPTRSLARVKRSLAGLPGGGGTPLAAGIEAGAALAEGIRRKGETPVVVLLTDGRANIARDGSPGRARAEADALAAAKALGAAGVASLVIDMSPQPQPTAARIADAMRGRYLPLPYADATALSVAVRGAAAQS